MQLCDNQLAAGGLPTLRTQKPHVIVAIDAEDLADTTATGPGAGTTGFGARISAARTRWLACDGMISRIVMGPDGQPLDVGRTQRVVPPHIRRAVERRDGHCVFAGCSAPTHWCDVHHLVHWIDGGDTSLDELRAGVRTAPHQGPSRVPDRAGSRRAMAHLPPRRHRDPDRHPLLV